MPSRFNLRGWLADAFTVPAPTATPLTPAAALTGAPRADATQSTAVSQSNATSSSGMFNALSGLGGARDAAAAARPNPYRQFLTEEELVALMRGGVSRRIVELLPRWSLWKGFRVIDDSDDVNPLGTAITTQIIPAIRRADIQGRGLGEALLWPIVLGGGGKLNTPLRVRQVRGVAGMHVIERREFTVASWETDILSENFGKPRTYYITFQRPGMPVGTFEVHASRVWLFGGDALPPREWARNTLHGAGMHDSILQVMWDGIRNLSQTSASGAHIAQELSVSVFKIAGAAQKTASAQREEFLGNMQFLNMTKSVARAVFLGMGDDFKRVAANPTGYKDLSEGARLHLALLCAVPIALLYGEAPSGLSADEGSWWAGWSASCGQHQQEDILPCLMWLIPLFYMAEHGAIPEDWSVEFNPLGELTQKELAEIRKINAESDGMDIDNGILQPARVARSRYDQPGGGYGHDIQPLTDEERAALEAGDDDPAELPDDEEPADDDPEREDRLRADGVGAEVWTGLQQRADLSPADAEALFSLWAACSRVDGLSSSIPKSMRSERIRVPGFARRAARLVLRWRRTKSDLVGMTATGWRRAEQLAYSKTIPLGDFITINAWFARHIENLSINPKDRGRPWRDAGYVSGLGWGSRRMAAYARRVVEQWARKARKLANRKRSANNRSDCDWDGALVTIHGDAAEEAARQDFSERSTILMLEVPPRSGFHAAQAAAFSLLPDLEPEEDPHVTLLYLGDVAAGRMRALQAAIAEALATYHAERSAHNNDYRPRGGGCDLFPMGVGHFGNGTPGPDGVPVVIHYATPLENLHLTLLRCLAPWIAVPQYKRFLPHAALGYLPRALRGAESVALAELGVPELSRWLAADIVLRRGREEVARFSLAPARLDAEEKPGSGKKAPASGTPAKPAERIKGSTTNPEGSATKEGAVKVSAATQTALSNKATAHNAAVNKAAGKTTTAATLAKVYRRGAGAFSTSHARGMSRAQWAMARVNSFLYLLRNGKPRNAGYTTDYDLLPEGHPKAKEET